MPCYAMRCHAMLGAGPAILRVLGGLKLDHSLKSFAETVAARTRQPQYGAGGACDNVRAVVVGGGPIGLRVSIELALLGAEVRAPRGWHHEGRAGRWREVSGRRVLMVWAPLRRCTCSRVASASRG